MGTGLLSLPAELLFLVLDQLNYSSRVALQWTCKQLYSAVDYYAPPDLVKLTYLVRPYNMIDLLDIEKWSCFSVGQEKSVSKQPIARLDFFACYICLRIRSAEHFSNKMMKGQRGKLSPSGGLKRIDRLCIDCGVKIGCYCPGTPIRFGGALGVGGGNGCVCLWCHQFQRLSCGRDNQKTCDICFGNEYRPKGKKRP